MSNSPKSGREHVRRMTAEFAVAFLLTFGFLISYYTLTSSATHFYARYYGPLFLFGACAIGSIFSWFIRRSKASVFLLIVMFLGQFSWYHWTTHTIGPGEGFSQLAQVDLVDERVPLFEPVAAWQSGTLGYFRDGVVNLGGKVNAEAMAWRGDMNSYLEKRGIRYICDWTSIVEAALQDPKAKGWGVVARKGRFTLYERSRTQRE